LSTRWIIHLKSGKSYTDKEKYPWDVPEDEITSVERIISGRSISIKKHPALHNFFVKTTESRDLAMMTSPGQQAEVKPPMVEARTVGAHIGESPNVYRLELFIDPRNQNVQLQVTKVEKATRDGF